MTAPLNLQQAKINLFKPSSVSSRPMSSKVKSTTVN